MRINAHRVSLLRLRLDLLRKPQNSWEGGDISEIDAALPRVQAAVACYETVYIVSNWPLEDQYHEAQMNKPQDWQSFLRRIHTVTVYHANGTIDKYDSVKAYFDRDKPPVQQVLAPKDWTDGEAGEMSEQNVPF